MRNRVSMVALFAVSLAAACGYDPHPKNGGPGDGGGGKNGLDAPVAETSSSGHEASSGEAGNVGEAGGGTDGGGTSGLDGSGATGEVEAGGEAAGPYDLALEKPDDVLSAAIDGSKDTSSGGNTGKGGAGGAGGVIGTSGIGGAGGVSGLDAPIATGGIGGITGSGGTHDTDAPLATGGAGGTIATGGMIATGGSSATGGIVATGGTDATGGVVGTGGTATGGTVGTGGAGTGGTTGSCTNACTAGVTQCLSGTTLQTCAVGGDGCTAFANSTCSTGLVCERYAPADCLDPNWAEWPMPNSQADVTAGAPNLESYTDNGDGTVTDNVTGLMWQQVIDPSTTYAWADALALCQTRNLGGYTDWRLPSLIEMLSIVDFGRSSPSINTTYFPATPVAYFWTKSTVFGDAWIVTLSDGSEANFALTTMGYARCVR